ncbi:MAG: retron St85 family RNA-directed DNA polymerase [Oceanicaulis sp.]|nr:retron St85 family RNA-directed DNA polymerase [Oceanicaulis sp.]
MSIVQTKNYWISNFERSGIKSELIDRYLAYIEPLLKNEVPIIFDFNHLCLLLERNRRYLASAINSSSNHYREFEIPKRSGGKRIISAPFPALLECQRWILRSILTKVELHSSAHAFTRNKSIISNSKIHVGQEHFLKIDLENFFPSISINQVINVFKSLGYTHKVSFFLASLCCHNDVLPQGAPTSPALSNIVAKNLDKRLMSFAKKFNLRYTRYADDLGFSGKSIPVKHIDYITNIIESCGFTVNNKKTVLQQKCHKRIITGISIAENVIKVPRQYKRKLKLEIHFIRKYGIISHIRKNKIKNPDYLLSIIGKIHFWLSVEPDNEYAKKALFDLKNINT